LAIDEFEFRSFPILVSENIRICRDPKDDKFLSLAISAKAVAIVTGDLDLMSLKSFKNIPILTAPDFLNSF
jgi:putative PIN family toxin of toxin-antitoxin system